MGGVSWRGRSLFPADIMHAVLDAARGRDARADELRVAPRHPYVESLARVAHVQRRPLISDGQL